MFNQNTAVIHIVAMPNFNLESRNLYRNNYYFLLVLSLPNYLKRLATGCVMLFISWRVAANNMEYLFLFRMALEKVSVI